MPSEFERLMILSQHRMNAALERIAAALEQGPAAERPPVCLHPVDQIVVDTTSTMGAVGYRCEDCGATVTADEHAALEQVS